MNTSSICRYTVIFIATCLAIYVIGSGIYIISRMARNHQLMDTRQCMDVDTSRGMVLERDNYAWNQRYTVIRPSGGVVELKCPTDQPTYYFLFNQQLTGYMESDDLTHHVNITGCNNLIRYNMRVGESFPILINGTIHMASAAIWQDDRVIYYVKHYVYRTYDIDLYDELDMVVANLLYTDRWSIEQYLPVDHRLFLALTTYHHLYIDGFETDQCNQYIVVTIVIIAMIMMVLCLYCWALAIRLYGREDGYLVSDRINEMNVPVI